MRMALVGSGVSLGTGFEVLKAHAILSGSLILP